MLPAMKVRRVACAVVVASALAGCSLLYNPDHLPPYVDPLAPVPQSAGPQILFEGQGTGGSRQAILAITGRNFAPEATVELLPTDESSTAPPIEIDNAHIVRGSTVLAVPVTFPVDMTPGAGDVKLTVQVTQMGSDGPVAGTLKDRVVLRKLPELDTSISDSTMLAPLYSSVKVTTALSFTPLANASPVVIRAVGAIELGDVHVDASGQTPGPGGGAAGAGGASLMMDGGKGGGPGGGTAGSVTAGGGGGAVSSDDLITSYKTSGSGGGGGAIAAGGGGGGTLELTAGGTLKVGAITSKGADGQSGTTGGGGGSGGVIVLRSGALATFGVITASGGLGGSSTGLSLPDGKPGGGGRLRYDVPSFSGEAPTSSTAIIQRGVAFGAAVGTNPLVTQNDHQDLIVLSEMGSTQFNVFVRDADDITTASTNVTFTSPNVIITPALRPGYNRICILPPGGNTNLLESTNCIDIAYVP
jgi:hypothetical protein